MFNKEFKVLNYIKSEDELVFFFFFVNNGKCLGEYIGLKKVVFFVCWLKIMM